VKITQSKTVRIAFLISFLVSVSPAYILPMRYLKKIVVSCREMSTSKKVFAGTVVIASAAVALVWGAVSGFDRRKRKKRDKALFFACKNGHLDRVKRLHKQGANLHSKVKIEESGQKGDRWPIFEAIKNGHLEIVEFLIKHGLDIDCKGGCENPLSLALSLDCKKFEIAEYLIKNGADLNDLLVVEQLLFSKLYLELYETAKRDDDGEWKVNLELYEYRRCVILFLLENGLICGGLTKDESIGTFQLNDFIKEKYKALYEHCARKKRPTPHELYAAVATKDLVTYINDDDCPCCLKQAAIVELFARGVVLKLEDFYGGVCEDGLSVIDMRRFFKKVLYNEWFLKCLSEVKAIPFIVEHSMEDKFDRDVMAACIDCCKDGVLIEKIVANYFVKFEKKQISSSVLQNWLVPKKQKDGVGQQDDLQALQFSWLMKGTKRRNKQVYRQLLNRFNIACRIDKITLPKSMQKGVQEGEQARMQETEGLPEEPEYLDRKLVHKIASFVDVS